MASFQSDAFQSDAFDADGFSASGGLALTAELAQSKNFKSDEGVLSDVLALRASLATTTSTVGYNSTVSFQVKAGLATTTATLGYVTTAKLEAAASLAATTNVKRTILTPETGAYTVRGNDTEILAPSPETFYLNLIVDLLPLSADNQRFSERLTVDGTQVMIKSWVYEESPDTAAGRLQIELADVSQRSLITRDAEISFEAGVWNGSSFDWTSLFATGYLDKSDYKLSRVGTGGGDSFTFTALSELTAKLNQCPSNNLVFYNSDRHSFTVDDFEGWYDVAGVYHPPTLYAVSGLTMKSLADRVFVSICGFRQVKTNLPNWALGYVDFPKGKPVVETFNGIIGMFDADYSQEQMTGGTRLWIRDGTSGNPPSFPAPRQITVSRASALGVSADIQRIDALDMNVQQERFEFDYYTDRTETPPPEISGFIETEVDTTYRDFFRRSQAKPLKTETIKVRRKSRYGGRTEISRIIEEYTLDRQGRVTGRFKKTMMLIPVTTTAVFWTFITSPAVAPEDEETTTNEDGSTVRNRVYANGTRETYTTNADGSSQTVTTNANGDTTTVTEDVYGNTTTTTDATTSETTTRFVFVLVSKERETITYAPHPFEPRQYYTRSREINKEGLVFVDGENKQQGEDFAQEAFKAYLSGNVEDTHDAIWTEISTTTEEITPERNNRVRIKTTEIDYLLPPAGSLDYREEIRDGEVGVNIFVVEQRKVTLYRAGASEIGGYTDEINMGELPLSTAVSLGERILLNQNSFSETVNLESIGIDPTLQKGTPVNARGRGDADLGNYIIEGRTMRGGRDGYFTTLQGKQTDD